MPAPVLRHDPSGIVPESLLGLDAPGAGRLDARWPNSSLAPRAHQLPAACFKVLSTHCWGAGAPRRARSIRAQRFSMGTHSAFCGPV